jgi:hypothetical protein
LTPSTALTDDGWSGFVNRFSPDGGTYLGGYVSSPGESEGGLAAIQGGEGGVEQGDQQLVIISDYNNNADQTAGNRVEANTFRERTIVAGDVGQTLTFSFDAKRGNTMSARRSRSASTPSAATSTLRPIQSASPVIQKYHRTSRATARPLRSSRR